MLSIVVVKGKNNIIGKEDRAVWNIMDNLKNFKKPTKDHVIIMGRKTFEKLGKILPDRKHIVFSQNRDYVINDKNVKVVTSMLEIQEYIETEEECFVIGGAMIYNLLMPHVQKMYVTEIDEEFKGDTFFPKINLDIWKETLREKEKKDEINNFDFDFVIYNKK